MGIWLFMAATFVVGGAYDTDEFKVIHRVIFWFLVTALLVFQPVLFEQTIARFTPANRLGAWLSAIGAALLAIPIIAIELHLLKFTPLLPRAPDPWIEFIPFVGAPVIIVAGFVLFLRFAWERRVLNFESTGMPPAQVTTTQSRLLSPDTLYVRSQDHYLEITRANARRFVRGRLKDIELEGEGWGFIPHRSWWVADEAVVSCRRQGRDLQLVLIDGTRVPVSRSKIAIVRSRGFIS